jgi:1,4-dihydroxy-6-naphthoate synthase
MVTTKETLTLGYSTCPNDTFLFHALAHGLVKCDPYQFSVTLEDVETLNQNAKNSIFHISKLSFAALGNLLDTYALLRSGAALGRGCGPLVVARPGMKIENILSGKIAVPGLWTTAFLLLTLYLNKKPDVRHMTFDRIMPSLQQGESDYGVIIHEGRFTYQEYGLVKLLDLGEWWEQTTSMPIPLGGIGIQRSLGPEIAKKVEASIRESVEFAFQHPEASKKYIATYAQEMSSSTMKSHIDLYVNPFTVDLGEEGVKAVETLFSMARESGAIADSSTPVFAY